MSAADHPGPPLSAPAITSLVTFLASLVVGSASGSAMPSPFGSTQEVQAYFVAHPTATSFAAWLMVLSAVFFAVLAAIAWSRLTFLAPNAPGPALAGVGGLAAALLLAVSAALTWTLSRPDLTSDGTLVHALHATSFALGGPVYVATLGIMMLGLGVTTLFLRRTPRWLSILGLVIAAIDLLATVSLVTDSVALLIPIGRFASLIWIVAISLLIPRGRGARRPAR